MAQWRAQIVRDCVTDGIQLAICLLQLCKATSKLVIVFGDGFRTVRFRAQKNYHVARDARTDIKPLFGAISEDASAERLGSLYHLARNLRQREADGIIIRQRFSNK